MAKEYNDGFTLLEVLVALVIIAVAFSAIYLSLSTSIRTQAALQDKTAATWVGLNIIAKLQSGLISSEQSSGKELMFNQNWNWQIKTQDTPNPSIMMLNISIRKDIENASSSHLIGYITKSISS